MGKRDLKKTIYKITVLNWEKWNANLKKGHQCILLSTGFLNDPKVRSQTLSGRLLFLSCLLLAGESKRSQFEVNHESLVFQSGVKSGSLESQLSRLQSFQLATYEKIPFSQDKREEKKGKSDVKGKEGNEFSDAIQNPPIQMRKPKASAPEGVNVVIGKYCELWKSKYQSQAPIRGKDAGLIKTLVSDFGVYKATEFIEAYLEMPDSWFVTKRHDITTLINNLNAVAQFIETGRMFTKREVNNLDSSNTLRNTLDAIDRGEI